MGLEAYKAALKEKSYNQMSPKEIEDKVLAYNQLLAKLQSNELGDPMVQMAMASNPEMRKYLGKNDVSGAIRTIQRELAHYEKMRSPNLGTKATTKDWLDEKLNQ